MVRCPRCDGAADELEPLPPGAIPDDGPTAESTGSTAVACQWCVREITEG